MGTQPKLARVRNGVKSIKLTLLLVLVFSLAALVLQNQALWQVHFLWFTGEVSGIILLFLTAAAGFVGGLVSRFR